jgi:hypothetical protein
VPNTTIGKYQIYCSKPGALRKDKSEFSNSNRVRRQINEMQIQLNMESKNKFCASKYLFAMGIAISSRMQLTTTHIANIELNTANVENSDGEYSLVIIGSDIIPIICERAVPVTRVLIDLIKLLLLFLSNLFAFID